jgi:hypothetical protein
VSGDDMKGDEGATTPVAIGNAAGRIPPPVATASAWIDEAAADGMYLDKGAAMSRAVRPLLPLLALALAACPQVQHTPGDDVASGDDAGVDAVPDGGTAPVCKDAVATCSHTFRYAGPGQRVILRGDFAADGWTVGVPMTRVDGAWQATVPARDQQVIVYKLVVDGTWQADPGNPRTSPDGFGGRNSVVRVDCDECPARPPFDWRDAIMYFVLIDRFANGDPANDAPIGVERPADYQGGDLAGLRQKIESGYFDELGVNALWLTSPVDNADSRGRGTDGHQYSAYHGYWPKDLARVESRIGRDDELAAVVAAAHARNINVILDYVMNHVHSESPIYTEHPDWF